MVLIGPKGNIFPHAVGELLYNNPAPLYGVKLVPAPDSEAACLHAG